MISGVLSSPRCKLFNSLTTFTSMPKAIAFWVPRRQAVSSAIFPLRSMTDVKDEAGNIQNQAATMKLVEAVIKLVIVLYSAFVISAASAQDTHYPPDGQQIPPSRCLILRDDTE